MKTIKRLRNRVGALLLGGIFVSCVLTAQTDITKVSSKLGTNIFTADSASIAQNYVIPEWFKDAKFGIFIHWGVYSVPAYGSEWYARWMYKKGDKINKFHIERYGPVDKFGYKDFIPMFKGVKFNADTWAKIFKESGAEYVVPVAEHHDGFAMYKSDFNKWNAVEMGLKRNIIGELRNAILKQGLHFGLSSHRAENAWFFNYGMETPSDVQDTTITLYGERLNEPEGKGMTPFSGKYDGSNERSRKQWLQHTYELIDKYQPELIWFDWTVGKYPFQPTFYQFMAHYYNCARDWKKEVVVNTKFGFGDNIQVFDIERGKSDVIRKFPWQTDTSVGTKSWSYCEDEVNKTPNHIIDDFIDIVSKNGNLLLNVGPRADGSITDEQANILRSIGGWLKVNGEAIFKSRPWVIPSEGATIGTSGYMTDNKATDYKASDIRFTVRDNNLYAISLAWTNGSVLIKSLANCNGKNLKVKSVSMLGTNEKIIWKQTKKGLLIKFPKQKPTDYAHAFKIELTGIAIGKLEIENGSTYSLRTFNHSDSSQSIKLSCKVGNKSECQKVNIPAKSYEEVDFDIKNISPDSKVTPVLATDKKKFL